MPTGVDSGLDYTPLVPFNNTTPTGGNSLNEDLNVHYEVDIIQPPVYPGQSDQSTLTLSHTVRRHCLDACSHRPGASHDSWCRVGFSVPSTHRTRQTVEFHSQILLLGSRTEKIRLVANMAHDDGDRRDILSVVFLGLFALFLPQRW